MSTAFMLLIVIFALVGCSKGSSSSQPTSAPSLLGQRLDAAEKANSGLKIEATSDTGKAVLSKANWEIIDQTPKSGEPLSDGTVKVTVTNKVSQPKETAPAADRQAWADQIFNEWLQQMGVTEPIELQSSLPDSLAWTLNAPEQVLTGELLVTSQVTKNETTQDALKQQARSILQLVCQNNSDLDQVRVRTADSGLDGTFRRADSLVCN